MILACILWQDYCWARNADDADEDIGLDDEDDKQSASECAPSGPGHEPCSSMPFLATFMMGSPEILSTKMPLSDGEGVVAVHGSQDGASRYISDNLASFADILKDDLDIGQLDIDAEMADLGVGQKRTS